MRVKGFTLAEIIIVISIISLLAAVSIPNMLRTRIQANEGIAIASLKAIQAAEVTYRSANSNYGTLEQLGNLSTGSPPFIDSNLGCSDSPCRKGNYWFSVGTSSNPYQFVARAVPINKNTMHTFCMVEDGTIKISDEITNTTTRNGCKNADTSFAGGDPLTTTSGGGGWGWGCGN